MPTRGTTWPKELWEVSAYFNPRAHEGHDLSGSNDITATIISIHVPTRGTTVDCYLSEHSQQFQSTCPRGARLVVYPLPPIAYRFQSTCPRGARQPRCRYCKKALDFNPRAHEGHDYLEKLFHLLVQISIHVPTRGTTPDWKSSQWMKEFQSTCPRGARR